MRAALLYGGEFRTFEYTFHNSDIAKFFDCDYYLSTWDYSKQQYDNSEDYFEFQVTPELINKIIPSAKFEILNEKNIFTNPVFSTNKLFFHWQNALKLMLSQNKIYDVIIVNRFDSQIRFKDIYKHPTFLLDENILYGDLIHVWSVNPFRFGVNDHFYFGSYVLIKKFLQTLPDFSDDKITFDCHNDLADHIIYNLKTCVSDVHPFNKILIRPHKKNN